MSRILKLTESDNYDFIEIIESEGVSSSNKYYEILEAIPEYYFKKAIKFGFHDIEVRGWIMGYLVEKENEK